MMNITQTPHRLAIHFATQGSIDHLTPEHLWSKMGSMFKDKLPKRDRCILCKRTFSWRNLR